MRRREIRADGDEGTRAARKRWRNGEQDNANDEVGKRRKKAICSASIHGEISTRP
jgi:hypothetical protein